MSDVKRYSAAEVWSRWSDPLSVGAFYVLSSDHEAAIGECRAEVERYRAALSGLMYDEIERECDECGGVAVDCPSDCAIRIARKALLEQPSPSYTKNSASMENR
jgi:hypothetical protein